MKAFSLSLLMVASVLLTGCGNVETDLPGTWRVSRLQTNVGQERDIVISEEIIEAAREHAMGLVYRFHEDHTFEMSSKTEDIVMQGFWEYNPDRSILMLRFDDDFFNQSQPNEIISFSAGRMVWGTRMGQKGYVNMTLDRE